ncbi:10684_t:CDS:2 [Entrophospora sp. SA101]|nr:10684_t:CDS:2 [Entrophospora sp. SA101]
MKRDIKLLEVNPSQVVNNYITTGDINVNQGHALIGNTIGADANITKSIIAGKKQLTDRISNSLSKKKINLTKIEIEAVIEELLSETKKALINKEEVRLQGYFTLKTAITKPRIAMNLQEKKKMTVPAKRVPKYKEFEKALQEAEDPKNIGQGF